MYENQNQNEIIQLFSELLAIPSPSGMEHRLADHIFTKCAEWGYSPMKDYAGNVYVQIPGQKESEETCCLAAHIDEIGVMVTKINTDGTLNVERVGGTLTWKFGERPVEILGEKKTVHGVTAMGSGHTAGGTQRLEWRDVVVITGLPPERLQEYGVKPGTLIVPLQSDRGPILFGEESDPMIAAWTFDDKIGVVTLLRLLKTIKTENITPYVNLIIAFTTTEEIGCFGAKHLAQSLNPTYFIAVDGCPFASESPMELDSRPGIRIRDRTFFYSPGLIKALSEAAENAGTELQHLVYTTSGSDAGMAGNVGASPQAACIGHIRKNSHGFEVAYLSVFENLYKTLRMFISTWKGA
ncbi:MAG: M20/M25/M40 family metallo-hydrolase [Candidatus Heimdallarchaeota archaeon]|nr:MAG: M20/M25/M40 family metallo-hydrolase [Candidatus Heimdallarchaeota archaeon]